MSLPPLTDQDLGDEDQLSLSGDDPGAFDGMSFGEWARRVSQWPVADIGIEISPDVLETVVRRLADSKPEARRPA